MSQARQVISIPLKIKRSPTDLLKALSKTVETDYNGPHYSLIDDTILTPISQIDKKRNLLSKSSGIKAARFMIEKYPQAFMKDDCVPHIAKFFPPKYFTEEELKYPSEDLIYSLISWGKFKEAFNTYLKCKDQSVNVSEECKMSLLDVLSIHNSNDLDNKSPIMENWYINGQNLKESDETETKLKEWKKDGEAELMFKELNEKNAQAYCSLIKGMAKHLNVTGANELYQEMKNNNLIPDLNTLNELVSLIKYDNNSSNDKKIELIMEKLIEMKNYGIRPNLRTFNSCLKVISELKIHQKSITFALNILKEMEFLNIKPSLATWSYILCVFYPTREYGPKTQVFTQILDEVEKMSSQGLEWKDTNDPSFFTVAIEKCFYNPTNRNFIPRIHSILMKNNNIKFLNNETIYNNYFENYLSALIRYETPEVILREWRLLTPHVISRSNRILRKMFDFAHDNACYDFVPELWTNFIESKQRRNIQFSSNIIKTLLSLMSDYKEKGELLNQYGSIIEMISSNFSYIDEKKDTIQQDKENMTQNFYEFEWDAKMLENFFNIAINTERLDVAWKEFEKYSKYQNKVHGELSEKCISNLFDIFLNNNHVDKSLKLLNFAVTQRLPPILLTDFIAKLNSSNVLTDEQKKQLELLTSKKN